MSNRPSYHDEIDRICDIAAAEENTRLMNGGAGIGDPAEGVEHEGTIYPFEEEYAKPLAKEEMDIPFPPAVVDGRGRPPVVTPRSPTALSEEVHVRVDAIRKEAYSFGDTEKRAVGYLLEVIDAYERGQL
jgi:hypothetical protein